MTPDQLKASILQLAIQGRLVPQRPEEGTAEDLYREIQREKKKLIAAGQIKKQKPLPPITEEELLFDIPETWKWVHFDSIARTELGKTLDKFKNTGDYYPYLCSINVYWEGISTDKVKEARFEKDELPRYRLQKGDLLICEGGDTGRCSIWESDEEMYYQNALHRVRFYGGINPYFYKYLMEYFKHTGVLKEYSKGQTIKHLVQKSLCAIWIPLPPLAEQKRIVAKIEQTLPLIERYGEAYTALETLDTRFPEDMRKSILQYAIQGKLVPQRPEEGTAEDLYKQIQQEKKRLIAAGKIKKEKPLPPITEDEIPFDIPETWKWVRFGEVVLYGIGKTPPRKEPIYWQDGKIPWVSIADMSSTHLVTNTKECVNDYAVKNTFRGKIVPEGTLLMSFKLTVGRTSILGNPACHNEAIISIYPLVAAKDALKRYLFHVLPLIATHGETKNAIKGRTLNSDSINALILPLPPIGEQLRIVEKIGKMSQMIKVN